MAGVLIPVVSRQRFDFTFMAASASKSINLRRAINVIPFGTVILLVRVHEVSIATSGASILVGAFTTDPSATDQQEFTISPAILSVSVTSTTPAPALLADRSAAYGPYLKLDEVGTQGAAQAALWVDLSVDLLARDN